MTRHFITCSLSLLMLVALSACQPEQQAVVETVNRQVRATGELTAANAFKASPPSVKHLWQYNSN